MLGDAIDTQMRELLCRPDRRQLHSVAALRMHDPIEVHT
jgi:hypothetical protein